MRATLMYGAGDVRVENVPDAAIKEPTDAVVRVVLSCVCGSDLWPYDSLPASDHGVAPARAYIEELMPDILTGTIQPGKVFDHTVVLDEVPAGYRAMADRTALKVLIRT